MKDAYWFRHDSNATADPRMMALLRAYDWRGYGLFWRLIELMRDCEGYRLERARIEDAAHAMRADELPQIIETCCTVGLFAGDDTHIWSERLCRDMQARDAQREAARAAVTMRWARYRSVIRTYNDPNTRTGQDSTVQDKTKDSVSSETHCIEEQASEEPSIPYEDIIGALNEETGHSYEWAGPRGEKNRVLIRNLWKRGFRSKDFLRVIETKCAEWGHPPRPGHKDMRPYLRPATLFSAGKFEQYLHQGDT